MRTSKEKKGQGMSKSESVKMITLPATVVELSPDVKATRAYKNYIRGVISAEECNKTLYVLGFRLGVAVEYNEQGQDLTTGYQKR